LPPIATGNLHRGRSESGHEHTPQRDDKSTDSGSPVTRRASHKEAGSDGEQPTAAKRWLEGYVGCNFNTRAAAAFASSSCPNLASGAASFATLQRRVVGIARRNIVCRSYRIDGHFSQTATSSHTFQYSRRRVAPSLVDEITFGQLHNIGGAASENRLRRIKRGAKNVLRLDLRRHHQFHSVR
jgi:hypothetical protein